MPLWMRLNECLSFGKNKKFKKFMKSDIHSDEMTDTYIETQQINCKS